VAKKQKDDELIHEVDEFFSHKLDPTRTILERTWFRNILYLMGEQWIDFNISGQRFVRRKMDSNIPTPVSNIIRDYVRSTAALILNKDFRMSVWPNTDEQSDRDAAKIGEDVLRYLDSKDDGDFLNEREKAAIWMLVAGTTFMRTFPAMDKGAFGFDKNGNPIKTGDVVREHILPFNVVVDHYGEKLSQKTRVGIQSLKPKEWVEDSFKLTLNDETNSAEIDYQRRLMTLVGNVSPWKGAGIEAQILTTPKQDLVIFKEIEYQPTKEYPNGRYVISAGGKIALDVDRMPIKANKYGWDYSLTAFHYNYVPGRFWADGGVSDQISPQNSINKIDQALEMNRLGIGRPRVITPGDIELKRLNKDGQSVILLQYDAMEAGGLQPKIEGGTPLPQQVLAERAIHQGVSQDAAGNPKNVLTGEAPSARASGVLVDELQEAAEESHVQDIVRFYRSLQAVERKTLLLVSEVFTENRMIKIEGKGTLPKIKMFKSSDLRGNTDVRISVASGIASTDAGKVNMVMRMIESGGFLFSELGRDPALQNQLLRRLGLDDFNRDSSVDIDRACEENSRIANTENFGTLIKEEGYGYKLMLVDGTDPGGLDDPENENVLVYDPLFKHDNHAIHYAIHRQFLLGDEFKSLDEKTQTVAISHAELHQAVMRQEQEAAMQAQIMAEQAKRTPTQAPPAT